MSIGVDDILATGGVGVVSEVGFGAGLSEVSRCVRFVRAVEFARIFGPEVVQAALVGLSKAHVMEETWGIVIDWWG
jgi:hypothetical protein